REAGHRAFLLDAPDERRDALAARLAQALADEGLELLPAHERLDLLHGVQNTYLAIFQALGGLGLALGSLGLLALVLRQALERRGELALFHALGFTRGELGALFLGEQGGLVGVGLALGTLAGAAAAAPGASAGTWPALAPLAGWIALVGVLALVWIALGARLALRSANLAALNRE
ncbi:MAG: ABC transporter permease, partial [Planctomycetota bacterium]